MPSVWEKKSQRFFDFISFRKSRKETPLRMTGVLHGSYGFFFTFVRELHFPGMGVRICDVESASSAVWVDSAVEETASQRRFGRFGAGGNGCRRDRSGLSRRGTRPLASWVAVLQL